MININGQLSKYWNIEIIECDECLGTWQLTDFTKELMGPEWVKKFNASAEYSLPKQPTAYWLGKNKLVMHPSLAQEIKNRLKTLTGEQDER